MKKKDEFVIIGAGPSGLAAAYELQKQNKKIDIFEKSKSLGGLARSIKFKKCIFDIGPHRFFTLNDEIDALYSKILGDQQIKVKRLTRIFYKKKFFLYPISIFNTLFNIGIFSSIMIVLSYLNSLLKKKIFKYKIKNFEDWIVMNFGRKLFLTFFKSYTEKVWGIDCKDISKDWAAQRIKNLNFFQAVFNALFSNFRKKTIKTLVDEFKYPKYGAGHFYKKIFSKTNLNSGKLNYKHELIRINHKNRYVHSVDFKVNNKIKRIHGKHFLLSSPFTEIFKFMSPSPPKRIMKMVENLNYRNHICVQLIVKGDMFKDNWIYVHDSSVKMARLANYNNFSKEMSYSKNVHPITVEYFVYEKDKLWNYSDLELKDFAEKELRKTGIFLKKNKILDFFIVKSKNAYPVIRKGNDKYVNVLKDYINSFSNLYPIGRSGMFKYNNQDHALATGIYTARNIIGEKKIDTWKINTDAVYSEEKKIN